MTYDLGGEPRYRIDIAGLHGLVVGWLELVVAQRQKSAGMSAFNRAVADWHWN